MPQGVRRPRKGRDSRGRLSPRRRASVASRDMLCDTRASLPETADEASPSCASPPCRCRSPPARRSPPTPRRRNDKFTPARAQIAEKNWTAAIDELKKVNDPASADWNNLMGYSLRKADPANAGEAEKFYNEALRIEPRHRGALEYSGELYLMTGNLAEGRGAPGRARQGVLPAVRGVHRPEERRGSLQGRGQQVRRTGNVATLRGVARRNANCDRSAP